MPENKPSAEQFVLMFQSFVEGRSTREQTQRFLDLIEEPDYQLLLVDLVDGRFTIPAAKEVLTEPVHQALQERLDRILNAETQTVPAKQRSIVRTFTRWAAAAVFFIAAGAGIWFLTKNSQSTTPQTAKLEDVKAPEKNRAMITLQNGEKIYLDQAGSGQLAMQGKVKLTKLANGQIVYMGDANEVQYNTLSNPEGSQPIDMALSDGSHVWLNAGSSITYPVAFVQNQPRLVTMEGEAAYKVVHDAANKFQVKIGDHIVEDIGTEFNINGYKNEPEIKTTLIEGSASVSRGVEKVTLTAGKETKLVNGKLSVVNADVAKAIAWRDGLFNFEGADIHTIGRQLARWYNIDVVYADNLPQYHFGGDTYRNTNLNEVLKVLELAGVHFKLEAATENNSKPKLTVLP